MDKRQYMKAVKMQKYEVGHARKKEVEMEPTLKEKLKMHSIFGMIKNVDVLAQRVTKKILVKASGVATARSTSYEASEAYKAHLLEAEVKRSQGLAEAQRQNLRGR